MENVVIMGPEMEVENPVTAKLWKNLGLFAEPASLFHRGEVSVLAVDESFREKLSRHMSG